MRSLITPRNPQLIIVSVQHIRCIDYVTDKKGALCSQSAVSIKSFIRIRCPHRAGCMKGHRHRFRAILIFTQFHSTNNMTCKKPI